MTQKPRRFDLSPDNFLAGIGADLKADELGLYWLICLRIYSAGGPIPYDEAGWGTQLNRTDLRIIRRASARLQVLGKISVSSGYVMAKGCASAIEQAVKRIETASENGRKGGRPPKQISDIAKPDGLSAEKLPSPSLPPSPPPIEGASEVKAPSKRERKVKSQIPDDCPSLNDRETALRYWRDHGRDDLCARLEDELEAFRAHHRAKGSVMADWSAAWRTWYGNAVKFNRLQGPVGDRAATLFSQSAPPQSADDRWRRKLQLYAERRIWLSPDGAPPLERDGKPHPDCCVPKRLLAEFGFLKPEATGVAA